MAADFEAGSIEGTLGLDTEPFRVGLDKANQQGKAFARGEFKASVSLDETKFNAEKDKATVALDRLGAKTSKPKIELQGVPAVLAQAALLKKALNPGGISGGGLLGAMKLPVMIGGVLSLVAALGPLAGVLAGIGAAGVAAFGGIAIALGLFAAVVKSAIGEITKANAAGVTLTGWAGKAQKALHGISSEWKTLTNAVKPAVFRDVAQALGVVAGIIPKLTPLLRATASGVGDILTAIGHLTQSKLFDRFLATLTSFTHGFLSGAAPVISGVLAGLMHLFIALQPLMSILGAGIKAAAGDFQKFAAQLDTGGGIKGFIDYVRHWLPVVMGLFGALFTGVRNLLAGLTPLAGPAISFISKLVTTIGTLKLGPVAKGLGDMLNALRPLLPVLGTLVNTLLAPLGHLLSSLAKGPVHDLTHGLGAELHPAFKALRSILNDLVQPVSDFAGSLANLANPTGAHLIVALLTNLQGVVHTLAPALSKLAVALEGVVDNGIRLITPAIPTLTKGLTLLVGALVPVSNALAKILAHKAVAGVILGIAGAVYVGVKAFQLYRAAVAAIAVVQGIIEAVSFGWAGLTVAQDANTASVVANKAAMIAFKAVGIVSTIATTAAAWVAATAATVAHTAATVAGAAASKAMAAAQWLLDAAMDANPITLVVIAIAALAAGLIYAYTHSTKFREIVNAAFTAVKNVAKGVLDWLTGAVKATIDFVGQHWKLILSILTGPIGAAVIFLISHWAKIKAGFSDMIHAVENTVKNGIDNVVGWFTSLPGKIEALAGKMLAAGEALMSHLFTGLKNIAGGIEAWVAELVQKIIGPIQKAVGFVKGLIPGGGGGTASPPQGFGHPGAHAKGTITNGPEFALIGDNPGGREAVIPLDKYDLPKKGDVAAIAGRAAQANAQIVGLLTLIANHLAVKADYSGLQEALAGAFSTAQIASAAKVIELTRKGR